MEDLDGEEIRIAYTSKLLELNVLLQFFGVSVEGDPYTYEEIGVFASSYENTVLHSYVLFVSDQVLGPLPIVRVIADAIEFIEQCDKGSVIEDLKGISTSYAAIDSDHENPAYYNNAVAKHIQALELIKKTRSNIN